MATTHEPSKWPASMYEPFEWPAAIRIEQEGYGPNACGVYDATTGAVLTNVFTLHIEQGGSKVEVTASAHVPPKPVLLLPEAEQDGVETHDGIIVERRSYPIKRGHIVAGVGV